MVQLERVSGSAIMTYVEALARLRIKVFRAFPYLYEGDAAYEERYIRTYAETPESVFVLAKDGGDVVGVATGMPMAAETPEVRAPFEATGADIEEIFYFGESVLLPQYRGQRIGVGFFEHRENYARALGRFKTCVFCAVQRPSDHPERPADHVPLDAFWRNRGYRPAPARATTFSWRDVGAVEETDKPMMFWVKDI